MAIKRVNPPEDWWHKLGVKMRNLYRQETFDADKNVYGSDWAGGKYSPEYEEYKKKGDNPHQAAAYAKRVTAVFSTATYKDLKATEPKAVKNGVEFGFKAYGDSVRSLAKRGKDYTLTSKDKPLPKKVVKEIVKRYNSYIKKNSKNTTRHHRKK